MMKGQIKLYNVFLLLILFLFVNCKDTSKVDDFVILDFYQVFQNDIYNVNAYILNDYDKTKSLEKNLFSQDSLVSLNLTMSKEIFENIRNKDLKNNFVLGKLKLDLNKRREEYKKTTVSIKINERWIKCHYYLIFDGYNPETLNIIYYDESFPLEFDSDDNW